MALRIQVKSIFIYKAPIHLMTLNMRLIHLELPNILEGRNLSADTALGGLSSALIGCRGEHKYSKHVELLGVKPLVLRVR